MNSSTISDNLFNVVRFCFASLCYHRGFLAKVLQSTSRIRTSQLFMNVPDNILNMTKCLDYKATATNVNAPRLTGISPHVVIMNNLSGITTVIPIVKILHQLHHH